MEFDWNNIFLKDLDWSYAGEIVLRTIIMFVVALMFLRFSGKKGIRQLSLFEVAIIISLGSAIGDPMFNDDAAIIPSLVVTVTILVVYRLLTWLISKYEWFEGFLEGVPSYIIEEGVFVLSAENKHAFAKDEFLTEMRQQSIEHLGQVKTAILESNGTVSFYYYEDKEVKPGLPVLPKPYSQQITEIEEKGEYACKYCGQVKTLTTAESCKRCKKREWVATMQTTRVT